MYVGFTFKAINFVHGDSSTNKILEASSPPPYHKFVFLNKHWLLGVCLKFSVESKRLLVTEPEHPGKPRWLVCCCFLFV